MWRVVWTAYLSVWLASVGTGAAQDRLLYLEAAELADGCAILQDCLEDPVQTSRQVLRMTPENMTSFLAVLSESADMRNLPDMRRQHDGSQCTSATHSMHETLEDVPLTDAAGTLRGLTHVHFDAMAVKGPNGDAATFGAILHPRMVSLLESAGLTVVSAQEVVDVPGQPHLRVSFSPFVDDRGCIRPFRASLQLKQSVVMTRDTSIRYEATTWSKSVAQAFTNTNRTPEIAMMEAIDAFIADWTLSNKVSEPELAADIQESE